MRSVSGKFLWIFAALCDDRGRKSSWRTAMSDGQIGAVVQYLRDLVRAPAEAEPTDSQLLERFITQREEQAFATLLVRHGPMVQGICQRLLKHVQDAEDVFQATFLVLARKAGSVRKRAALAS